MSPYSKLLGNRTARWSKERMKTFSHCRAPEVTRKLGNTHLAYRLSRFHSLLFNFKKSQDYKEKSFSKFISTTFVLNIFQWGKYQANYMTLNLDMLILGRVNWRIKPNYYYFIVLLIGSTCFGHYYAHHQELATIVLLTTLVVSFCKDHNY